MRDKSAGLRFNHAMQKLRTDRALKIWQVGIAVAVVIIAISGCSNVSEPHSHTTSTGAATPSDTWTSDPVGYLNEVDQGKYDRSVDASLVAELQTRCTDDTLVLEFAATNTALSLVTATRQQDVYAVLHRLASDVGSSTKVACQPLLPKVQQELANS